MNQNTTRKVKTSTLTDRSALTIALRAAIIDGDKAKADAINYRLSMLDTNRAEAQMLLKAHERDQMNGLRS